MLELERLLGIRYFDGCHFHISNSGQSFEERKNEVRRPWLSHTGAPFIALFCFHSPSLSGRLAHQPHPGQVAKAWVAAGTQVRTLTGVDEFDLGVFQTITYDLAHQVRGLNGGSRVSMLGSHGRNLARFKQRMNGS